MKLKTMIVSLMLTLVLTGCAILEPVIEYADFKLVKISKTDGITVSVRGNMCNFPFVADKAAIYAEVKRCAMSGLVLTATPLPTMQEPITYGPDGEIIETPVAIVVESPVEVVEEVDIDIDQLATAIAEEAAKQ